MALFPYCVVMLVRVAFASMLKIILSKPFAVACALTLVCSVCGSLLAGLPYLAVLGALVISLILGMCCQVARPAVEYAKPGIALISNKFLRAGIILLGFKLDLIALAQAGVKTIALACVVVAGTIFLAYHLARRFGVDKHLAILTASGTGICGAAAVMGIASQLPSSEKDATRHAENKVVAVAIIAILGTLFTLADIAVGPALGMSATQFGVMAGASLHEIAHAVAAGGVGGGESLDIAIITKLSRVLLLAPAAIIIGVWYRKSEGNANQGKGKVPIPWFMAGFVAASVFGTFAPLPQEALDALVKLSYLLLGMAMAALGMTVNFRVLLATGRNAFAAALVASIVLLAFAATMALLFF